MIFPARFLFDWMVEDFMRILPHLLAASRPKCKLHLYKGIFRGHARHAPSLLYFFFVLAAHVEAFWAMCWPSCWPLLWTWAFQCRWVVVYSSRFQKNIVNTKQNAIFGLRCWCFWCVLFCSVFSLFLGHVALGLCWLYLKLMLRKNRAMLSCCCVLFSPCWANVEPPWSMLGPCWVMLLALLGRCCVEPMWTHVALIWSHVAPCWADVDSCGEGHIWYLILGLSWAILCQYWAHVEPFWAMCWPLSCFGVVKFWVHARRL